MSAAVDAPTAARGLESAAGCWRIGGRVQGVGFRPFVYRLAHHHGLTGWVRNRGGEVEIHAQGPAEELRLFGDALLSRAPPAAAPRLLDQRRVALAVHEEFLILPSVGAEALEVHVPLDLFTCDECVAELDGPNGAPLPLSLHQLHPMRASLHADPRHAVRPAEYDPRSIRAVRMLSRRSTPIH